MLVADSSLIAWCQRLVLCWCLSVIFPRSKHNWYLHVTCVHVCQLFDALNSWIICKVCIHKDMKGYHCTIKVIHISLLPPLSLPLSPLLFSSLFSLPALSLYLPPLFLQGEVCSEEYSSASILSQEPWDSLALYHQLSCARLPSVRICHAHSGQYNEHPVVIHKIILQCLKIIIVLLKFACQVWCTCTTNT